MRRRRRKRRRYARKCRCRIKDRGGKERRRSGRGAPQVENCCVGVPGNTHTPRPWPCVLLKRISHGGRDKDELRLQRSVCCSASPGPTPFSSLQDSLRELSLKAAATEADLQQQLALEKSCLDQLQRQLQVSLASSPPVLFWKSQFVRMRADNEVRPRAAARGL